MVETKSSQEEQENQDKNKSLRRDSFLDRWLGFQKKPEELKKDVESEPYTGQEQSVDGPEQIGIIASRSNNAVIEKLPQNEAKTLAKEREELIKERAKFEKKIDKEIAKEQKNREKIYGKDSAKAEKEDTDKEKGEVTTESLEEFVRSESISKPETVFERVEAAAMDDIAIESLYEKRHEHKDSAIDQTTRVKSFESDAGSTQKHPTDAGGKEEDTHRAPSKENMIRKVTKPIKETKNKNPEIYNQAITAGFWTAITFLIIVFALILIS